MVIVKSGSFTFVDDDCSETTYSAGQVFVDQGFGHVHRAYNPGPGTTEVRAVYVIPRGAGSDHPHASTEVRGLTRSIRSLAESKGAARASAPPYVHSVTGSGARGG